MSVYININTLSNDNRLKDLSIPSCLYINPTNKDKNYYRLNLNDDLIDDKLYDILLTTESGKKKLKQSNKQLKKHSNKQSNKQLKKHSNKKTKKHK